MNSRVKLVSQGVVHTRYKYGKFWSRVRMYCTQYVRARSGKRVDAYCTCEGHVPVNSLVRHLVQVGTYRYE